MHKRCSCANVLDLLVGLSSKTDVRCLRTIALPLYAYNAKPRATQVITRNVEWAESGAALTAGLNLHMLEGVVYSCVKSRTASKPAVSDSENYDKPAEQKPKADTKFTEHYLISLNELHDWKQAVRIFK